MPAKKQLFTQLYTAQQREAVVAQNGEAKRNRQLLDVETYTTLAGIDSPTRRAAMKALANSKSVYQATLEDWQAFFAQF